MLQVLRKNWFSNVVNARCLFIFCSVRLKFFACSVVLVLIGFLLEVDSTIDSLPLTFFPNFSMSIDEQYAFMVNTQKLSCLISNKSFASSGPFKDIFTVLLQE
jgi:hypothetical protein